MSRRSSGKCLELLPAQAGVLCWTWSTRRPASDSNRAESSITRRLGELFRTGLDFAPCHPIANPSNTRQFAEVGRRSLFRGRVIEPGHGHVDGDRRRRGNWRLERRKDANRRGRRAVPQFVVPYREPAKPRSAALYRSTGDPVPVVIDQLASSCRLERRAAR